MVWFMVSKQTAWLCQLPNTSGCICVTFSRCINLWLVLNLGQNLLPTELQYSDGFAQLATHLLLEVNNDTGNVYFVLFIP